MPCSPSLYADERLRCPRYRYRATAMSACQRCQASSVESAITYCPYPRFFSRPSFYLHTPSKNPRPLSQLQAYIAGFWFWGGVEGVFWAPLCQAALCECARESVERLLKTASETRLLRHRRASLRDLPSAIFLR